MNLLTSLTTASIKELYSIRVGLLDFCNQRSTSQKIVDIAASAVLIIEDELARRVPETPDDGLYKIIGLLDADDLTTDLLSAINDAKVLLAA